MGAAALPSSQQGSMMRFEVDTERQTMRITEASSEREIDLFSPEAFELVADLWVRTGWVNKYSYAFSWLGRPIIQLPDDMVRIQEAIWQIKPDVIIETGVAHGGSLIFYASLMELIGKGRVIGLDIEVRPHNRTAIEAHPMAKRIEMIEGNSVSAEVVAKVRQRIKADDVVMLILDSDHSKAHVAAELDAFADLVTKGSFILSQDGVMQLVAGMPRTKPEWASDNPIPAVEEFLARRPEFRFEKPPRPFDESNGVPDCSHHPKGWIKRL
jgi:cephalosporin hydroxylase